MKCPKCQAPVSPDASQCGHCNAAVTPTVGTNEPHNPLATPVANATGHAPAVGGAQPEGDATGGVIPYKNPKALIAYYLGIVSGLPIIGLPFGVAAFVLGILGLKARSKNPAIKGSAHAWIGIGCGGLFALLWGILLIALIGGALMNV